MLESIIEDIIAGPLEKFKLIRQSQRGFEKGKLRLIMCRFWLHILHWHW